jgi:hypothetical protein
MDESLKGLKHWPGLEIQAGFQAGFQAGSSGRKFRQESSLL